MNDLRQVGGIGPKRARAIYEGLRDADPERDARLCEALDVVAIGQDDPLYPQMLKPFDDAPRVLWMRGTFEPEDAVAVAIVGSRRCTAYGRLQAGRFATALAEAGMAIVSGGALGIDAEAHRGALRVHGRTIAVLGSGLARPYPADHAGLFMDIARHGGVVMSEHPVATQAKAGNFPRRNRLIAALSLGVLVIEASDRSGALITARYAAETYHRDVMALPGRVDSNSSAGCHALIRRGHAALVRDVGDVMTELKSAGHLIRGIYESEQVALQVDEHKTPRSTWALATEAQRALLEILMQSAEPMLPDTIASVAQRPLSTVLSDLTALELSGVIERDHRGLRMAHGGRT
ncbi:MAG: DNA-processing protein DprA [Planctomycetota bacterium]